MTEGMPKFCTKCEIPKNIDDFHKNKNTIDGYHHHCKACRKIESLKKYNLSLEEYDLLVEEQNNKCAICGTTENKGTAKNGRWQIDHNHKTGEVRGLLCQSCNLGLGCLQDSPEILSKALSYLLEKGHYG